MKYVEKREKKPGFTCFNWLTAFGPAHNSWQHNSIGLPENLAYFDSQCVGLEAFFFRFFPFFFLVIFFSGKWDQVVGAFDLGFPGDKKPAYQRDKPCVVCYTEKAFEACIFIVVYLLP